MKPLHDPPRLLDPGSDAPAWLRSSLDAGARDVADPARLARIAARLPSGLIAAAPAVPSVLPGAVAGAGLGIALLGAGLGLALLGAGVGTGWVASPRSAAPPPSARPVTMGETPIPPAPSAIVMPAVPEPLRLGPTETPAPRPRPPPSSGRPESLPTGTAGPAASLRPEPVAPSAAPEPASPEPPAAESERAILQRAQDALRGSPAQALSLTDLHLARYPGGMFAQEREVLAISALLGMGRAADARARARRFVASFPASAHRRRLEVLIPDLESSAGDHKAPSDRPSTP